MLKSAKNKFLTTDLDANLLSTPFKVETKWHVITGASCSGKTTMINQLSAKGIKTAAETARKYFDTEIAKGRTIEQIREHTTDLQRAIDGMQKRLEYGLNPHETTFLDRALPDSLTFYRVAGLDPNEILAECFQHRYASVFLLDRLPFLRKKMLGPEDEVSASFVDEWLERDYSALGYRVVRVPFLLPEERLAFVLDWIEGSK
ncbi:MAG: ATP-binding protein [Chloroflexota bacterium]|nr:MAG: ATP-binding protein [Chloroflexota bacterium]